MSECIFCRIAARAIPAKIVYEDEEALAFEDVNPQAPVHLLIIPKRHVEALHRFGPQDLGLLGHLLGLCAKLAKEKGVVESGYRVVTNAGAHAGQTVFHLHLHVLGGRTMAWPPG